MNLDELEIPASVIIMIPEWMARENTVIPIEFDGTTLRVAFHVESDDPMAFQAIEKIRFMINKDIEIVAAPKADIKRFIDRHYGE